MVHFYIMSIFFGVFVLLHVAFEYRGPALLMAFSSLYVSIIHLFGAMSADGKYKMAKIVDELMQQRGCGSDDPSPKMQDVEHIRI